MKAMLVFPSDAFMMADDTKGPMNPEVRPTVLESKEQISFGSGYDFSQERDLV